MPIDQDGDAPATGSSDRNEQDSPAAAGDDGNDALAGHVFISYARRDSAAVDLLHQRLESAGIPVWRDTANLRPGQDWRTEIRRAIENNSLIFIACFSTNSTSRQQSYQNEELTLAVEQVRKRRPDVPWLIPIRLDDCEIPIWDIGGGRTLASIQRADLFGTRREDELERLVVAVKRMLANQPSELDREEEPYSPWPERSLDASDIETLNSREAARRLTLTRPDDAVRALAGASMRAAAEVLDVLLEDHEALAVTLLAHGRRNRARELIAAMTAGRGWLEQLPAAADAIDRCEHSHDSMLGQNMGPLSHAGPHKRGTHGFCRSYEKGQVLWSPRGGAQVIVGAIGDCYRADGNDGLLGFPVTAELAAGPSEGGGTFGSCQRFEGEADYGPDVGDRLGVPCGAAIYWSAAYGAYPTWGRIGEYYESRGGSAGCLGFPVSDRLPILPVLRERGDGASGFRQEFEQGSLYCNDADEIIEVPTALVEHLKSHPSRAVEALGFPVSPVIDAALSPYKTQGQFQRYEGPADYPDDIVRCWSADERPGGATIYLSSRGTYCVSRDNGVLYERVGGTGGWLGFPTSDEVDANASTEDSRRTIQQFEGGAIFYAEEYGPVTVPRIAMDYLGERPSVMRQLGFPLERPPETSPDLNLQFFEHGVVTIKDGAFVEAWVRPESTI